MLGLVSGSREGKLSWLGVLCGVGACLAAAAVHQQYSEAVDTLERLGL